MRAAVPALPGQVCHRRAVRESRGAVRRHCAPNGAAVRRVLADVYARGPLCGTRQGLRSAFEHAAPLQVPVLRRALPVADAHVATSRARAPPQEERLINLCLFPARVTERVAAGPRRDVAPACGAHANCHAPFGPQYLGGRPDAHHHGAGAEARVLAVCVLHAVWVAAAVAALADGGDAEAAHLHPDVPPHLGFAATIGVRAFPPLSARVRLPKFYPRAPRQAVAAAAVHIPRGDRAVQPLGARHFDKLFAKEAYSLKICNWAAQSGRPL